MPARIAFCGLDCALCPAYLASNPEDQGLRQKTAQKWWRIYDRPLPPSQSYCLGCQQAEGSQFFLCHKCAIRVCGLERGYQTCAECPDYACSQLERLLDMAPTARDNLEALRRRQGEP